MTGKINKAALSCLTVLILALPVYGEVNKSVKIPDGGSADGASSVNGSVTVGENATISGNLKTVNGAIRVGAGSTIESATTVNGSVKIDDRVKARNVETVNGAIKIAEEVMVDGEVAAVNGKIELQKGSTVARGLSNVNGSILLEASEVGGEVSTVNGDVHVLAGAAIRGDLVVKKPRGFNWGSGNNKKPKVVIGPGSRVDGVIRLEREVRLFISNTADVGGVEGVMTIDDAERFSGNRP